MCLSIGIDLLPKNNSNLPSDVIQGRVFDKIDYGVTCLPVKIGKQKYRQSPTKFLPQHVNWFVEFTNICELPLHVALEHPLSTDTKIGFFTKFIINP